MPACKFNIKHNTIFHNVSSSLHPLPSRYILHRTWKVLEILNTLRIRNCAQSLPNDIWTANLCYDLDMKCSQKTSFVKGIIPSKWIWSLKGHWFSQDLVQWWIDILIPLMSSGGKWMGTWVRKISHQGHAFELYIFSWVPLPPPSHPFYLLPSSSSLFLSCSPYTFSHSTTCPCHHENLPPHHP